MAAVQVLWQANNTRTRWHQGSPNLLFFLQQQQTIKEKLQEAEEIEEFFQQSVAQGLPELEVTSGML